MWVNKVITDEIYKYKYSGAQNYHWKSYKVNLTLKIILWNYMDVLGEDV